MRVPDGSAGNVHLSSWGLAREEVMGLGELAACSQGLYILRKRCLLSLLLRIVVVAFNTFLTKAHCKHEAAHRRSVRCG